MRESSRRAAILLLALLAAGCETQKPDPSKPGRLVFPPPPAEAVIEFVGTFSRAADFGLGQSGLQKILLGTEERDAAFIGPSSVAFAGDDGSFYVVDQRLDAVFIASRTRKEFRVFPGEGSGRIQASSPGLRSHSASISSGLSSMKAVVRASATVVGVIRGASVACDSAVAVTGRGTAAQAATRPRTGLPVRGSTMWSALRTPEAPSAVWRTDRRASTPERALGLLKVRGHPS